MQRIFERIFRMIGWFWRRKLFVRRIVYLLIEISVLVCVLGILLFLSCRDISNCLDCFFLDFIFYCFCLFVQICCQIKVCIVYLLMYCCEIFLKFLILLIYFGNIYYYGIVNYVLLSKFAEFIRFIKYFIKGINYFWIFFCFLYIKLYV